MYLLKLFRNKMEQIEMFQNFFEAKRNKVSCSETFQKQRGTNRGVPKFSEAKRNKKRIQKLLRKKEKQMDLFQKFAD